MICSCCNALITKDDPSTNCNVCQKLFRASCTEATRSDLKRFGPATGIYWSCKDCRSLDLKSLILSLQEDIKQLRAATISPVTSTAEDLIKSEVIIQEVLERERRRCNVVIFGVAESGSSSRAEREAADVSTVQGVFRSIDATVSANFKTVRLGKFDPTKPISKRPIKISLPSPDSVLNILKKSNSLRNSLEYPGIAISSDRTPFQQKLFNAVKAELMERKSKGEENIRIKHINGIPKIVSSEN